MLVVGLTQLDLDFRFEASPCLYHHFFSPSSGSGSISYFIFVDLSFPNSENGGKFLRGPRNLAWVHSWWCVKKGTLLAFKDRGWS